MELPWKSFPQKFQGIFHKESNGVSTENVFSGNSMEYHVGMNERNRVARDDATYAGPLLRSEPTQGNYG